MIDMEKMIADIRANLEARIREGYGHGSLTATVAVFPLNSEPQEWPFDARDYERGPLAPPEALEE